MAVAAFSSNFSNVTNGLFAQTTMQMAAQFFKTKRLSKMRIFFKMQKEFSWSGIVFFTKLATILPPYNLPDSE
jgi:ABC-type polysaccharide transport system permease subunit